jgi:hypothetical protein
LTYLVLEILPSDDRVPQQLAKLAGIRIDFATCPADVGVLFKHLVQLVDARAGRLGAYVEQYADVGIDERAKGVEEPAVSVSWNRLTVAAQRAAYIRIR